MKERQWKYPARGIVYSFSVLILWTFSGISNSPSDNFPTPFISGSSSAKKAGDSTLNLPSIEKPTALTLYATMGLQKSGLSESAFEQAVRGWAKLKEANRLPASGLLTIADFSQPSTRKRLYVIDLDDRVLLYQTYVAHGRNSGKDQAQRFSNSPSSYKSSPGFYRTGSTYYGSNGFSLRLEGLEKGINDNAGSRAIVMHGADYVNEGMIRSLGYLGRSQGCPAIPTKLTRPIINTIKNGSCLFIYAPVEYYAERSALIR